MLRRLTVRPSAALKVHPLWSQADFECFRGKGYTNQQVLDFWERDLRLGCKPVNWKPTDAKYQSSLRRIIRRCLPCRRRSRRRIGYAIVVTQVPAAWGGGCP